MCRRLFTLAATLVLCGMTMLASASASGLLLPARLYPMGAYITVRPKLSNHQMDCMWGYDCEGPVPLFHYGTQKEMHRLDGWGQFAIWHQGAQAMAFELFASRYEQGTDANHTPWSAVAFADFRAATRGHDYATLRLQLTGILGTCSAALQRSGPKDLAVVACWGGSSEVEAIAMFDHRDQGERSSALSDLSRQMGVALARA